MASNVILIRPSGITKGYTTIQGAVNGGAAEDTVIVYNGTYTEQIIIVDGVNIFCLPGVTMESSHPSGTLIDDGTLA